MMEEIRSECLYSAPSCLNEEVKIWMIDNVIKSTVECIEIQKTQTKCRMEMINLLLSHFFFLMLFMGCFIGIWLPGLESIHEMLKLGLFASFAVIINKLKMDKVSDLFSKPLLSGFLKKSPSLSFSEDCVDGYKKTPRQTTV